MSCAIKRCGPAASKERRGKGHNVYTPVQMVLFDYIRLPLQSHHNHHNARQDNHPSSSNGHGIPESKYYYTVFSKIVKPILKTKKLVVALTIAIQVYYALYTSAHSANPQTVNDRS